MDRRDVNELSWSGLRFYLPPYWSWHSQYLNMLWHFVIYTEINQTHTSLYKKTKVQPNFRKLSPTYKCEPDFFFIYNIKVALSS